MGSNVYSLVNAILFGLVMVEVSIQVRAVHYSLTSSTYFKFLLFTFLWVVLRFILSFDGINGNKQLSLMLLDLLYPCIVSSFLILSRHYIVVGF